MEAKHRWAATDPGRRFDDLCKLVHDPPTLLLSSESRR
jgi:RNA-directed DNA polymerase